MRQLEDLSPFLRSRAHLLGEPEAIRMLHVRSEQSQNLRRLLLRGATVLIVGGGPESKLRFFRHLASLHVALYLMDCPHGVWPAIVKSPDSPFRAFFPADLSDLPALARNARAAINAASGAPPRFDAVFTFFELYVQHAARVHRALSPGRDYTPFADCARSKAATREALVANCIPTPRYHKITGLSDVPIACAHVGFPAVLKPVSGVFSVGVVNVRTEAEVRSAVQQALGLGGSSLENNQKTANLVRLVNKSEQHEMILEQFLDGPEFDVDILFNNGEAVYERVVDNWAFEPPWCQDCGLQGPSRFSRRRQQELVDMAVRCAKAVGAVDGVVHAELRYTNEGPRLIEVNARMGGAAIFDLHQRVWGVDLVENHCMIMCGIPIRPMARETPLCHLSCIILYAPYSGQVTSERWLDFLLDDNRVIKVVHEKEKGAIVNGPEDSAPDWVGQVHIVGKTCQEVDELVKDIVTWQAPVPIRAKEAGRERRYFFPGDQFPFLHSHRL
ncbi:Carnosine synthase 1 [Gracilariopsis chorda]|uniref:Carnosine synthase 1 n=1 Tax=Gracilariopsis chorda TaxID=448386 RepID=A0A2V3J0T7_9FLOR|nr:Carnosine synthase 1 [Gracilariopsis chorda]|eukprot:PXF48026.1 Carnosine synthase 1 [Gracilariopsis chorda]